MPPARSPGWGTVRLRMTLAAMLVVTIAMATASWLLVASVRSSLQNDLRTDGALALADARAYLQAGYPADRLPPPREAGFDIVLVADDGQILGGSPGYAIGNWSDFVGASEGAYRDIVGSKGEPFPGVNPDNHHVWYLDNRIFDFVAIPVRGGTVYLVAAGPLGAVDNSVRTLTNTLWWTGPALIVLIGLVAWGVTGRALRPVELIRNEVTEITHSSLDQRVSEPRARDEVGRLARTMNEMLDRLQGSSARQRQFVSDASHELRSPVAAIRATGEVALAHPDAADWPVVVRRMLVEDNRMEQIVTDLLDLAREGETELPNTLVDLDDIALEEATRARRDGCTIVTEGVSAGQVRGSRELLTRVVRNLLDNAVRHAASTVRVTLRADADVTLVVEDDGPGIAPTDRAEVFERFARLDEGRARDTGGLGLGLAMVRTITERHGGSVEITDPTDPNFPGVRIIVRLRPAE